MQYDDPDRLSCKRPDNTLYTKPANIFVRKNYVHAITHIKVKQVSTLKNKSLKKILISNVEIILFSTFENIHKTLKSSRSTSTVILILLASWRREFLLVIIKASRRAKHRLGKDLTKMAIFINKFWQDLIGSRCIGHEPLCKLVNLRF